MNIYCKARLWCAAWKGLGGGPKKQQVRTGGCCHHSYTDWHLQQVIHPEREHGCPAAFSPAQVYDNANKLWGTAQTLKTLIGTKSNGAVPLRSEGAEQSSFSAHHYQFLSIPNFLSRFRTTNTPPPHLANPDWASHSVSYLEQICFCRTLAKSSPWDNCSR